jgi:serine/threonine-protein kinase RIO1
MFRITKRFPIPEADLERLRAYLVEDPATAPTPPVATNVNKNQYVFVEGVSGREVILKLFVHKKSSHRLASFFGVSSADRYFGNARRLLATGVPVPGPIALIKTGDGLLPDVTLYAMERAAGEMLYPMLASIESDARRIEIVAEKIVTLIRGLERAGVTHRDLNVKNVLLTPANEVTLIDLDSARSHASRGAAFRRRHQRDIRTFLETCHGAPRFAAAVAARLNVSAPNSASS